jgi:pimeloyl-ACP methyl ester carboxylesterase
VVAARLRAVGRHSYVVRACRNRQLWAAFTSRQAIWKRLIKAISRRSDDDPIRIIALGVSVGAAVLNLASRAPEGLEAVINVSGGGRTSPQRDVSGDLQVGRSGRAAGGHRQAEQGCRPFGYMPDGSRAPIA